MSDDCVLSDAFKWRRLLTWPRPSTPGLLWLRHARTFVRTFAREQLPVVPQVKARCEVAPHRRFPQSPRAAFSNPAWHPQMSELQKSQLSTTVRTHSLRPICALLLLSAVQVLSVQACTPDPPATASERAAKEFSFAKPSPDDPLADLEKTPEPVGRAVAPQSQSPQSPKKPAAEAPPGGSSRSCALLDKEPTRIWPQQSPLAIAAVGEGFVAAGYVSEDGEHGKDGEDGAERVVVVRVSPGALPRPLQTLTLKNPHPGERLAPPGLGQASPGRVTLAVVDGMGALQVAHLRANASAAAGVLKPIAQGADARMAPAVTSLGHLAVVAWTQGSTPMVTRLAVFDAMGNVTQVHDIRPPAMGAAAPTFVHGLSPPVLVMVDARQGFSPLLRVRLSASGKPGEAEIALPVGSMGTPPELAAARAPSGTYVGYTGTGSALTSAVGLVAIDPVPGSPQPMVKGTAYGQLHVAAAATPRAALFAADAPQQPGKDPPHEIHVHLVDQDGMGPATVVRGPEGNASHAALARTEGGTVAVAFTTASGAYVAWLRCDDG